MAEQKTTVDLNRGKRGANGRKPLSSLSEANIRDPAVPDSCPVNAAAPPLDYDADKENINGVSRLQTEKKKKNVVRKSKQVSENDVQELQNKLEQLRLEKEQTEDLLKARSEMLKMKEEELETRGRNQEKLEVELKRLQRLKEFKPTVSLPLLSSLDGATVGKKKKKTCSGKRRPSTPYILWCRDQWKEVKKANPGAEFREMSNILGAKWRNSNADARKPYEHLYKSEKEAYLKVMESEKREKDAMDLLEKEQKQKAAMELLEQYLQFKLANQNDTKLKKKKDPSKPKYPVSAYFLYANERRTALSSDCRNILQVAKITGEEWKEMTKEQRKPYEEIAKQKKAQYLQEMMAYKQKKEEEAVNLEKEEEELKKVQMQEALQLIKKKEKIETIIRKTKEEGRKKKMMMRRQNNTDPNQPKKPASAFLLFSKDTRKQIAEEKPGISNSSLQALVSVKWKGMSEEDKVTWNGKAAQAKQDYIMELEAYNKNLQNLDVPAPSTARPPVTVSAKGSSSNPVTISTNS